MFNLLSPLKTKHITLAVLVAFAWEFMFPYHAAAVQTKTQNNTQNPFANQIISAAPAKQTPTEIMSRLPVNDNKPQPMAKKIMTIPVTAYSSTPDQTSGDPFITASGSRVRDGVIAANFLPIGTKVRFPEKYGNKIFVVEDRMSSRYWHRADIWMPTRQAAKEWGIRHIKIEIL